MLAGILALHIQQLPPRVDLGPTVIYEANLRVFGKEKAFRNLARQLPAIKKLGVDTLWLMPIHPVGKVNSVGELGSPYSVADYQAINTEFGNPDDFRLLVRQARQQGMRVILDWVANHTSWDNPWIKNPDWYSRDESGAIIHPPGTNWKDVAELNYDSPEMRAAMQSAMEYWVTYYNVDGFRCDFAEGVPTDFWKETIQRLRAKAGSKPLLMLAESMKPELVSEAGFDLLYDWTAYGSTKDLFAGKRGATGYVAQALQQPAPAIRFVTNHDEAAWDASPTQHFGSANGALAAFALQSFLNGVPMVYSTQEIGYSEKVPFFSQTLVDWSSGSQIRNQYESLAIDRARLGNRRSWSIEDASNDQVVMFKVSSPKGSMVLAVNPTSTTQRIPVPNRWQIGREMVVEPKSMKRTWITKNH